MKKCEWIRKPSVLVLKEKHGDRYFHVPNEEALFAAALSILAERVEDGYWYDKPSEKDKPTPPDVTEEQIATLPKSLQEEATRKVLQYKRNLDDYNESLEEFEAIEKALRDKDGCAAWEILDARSDAEYEGCSIKGYTEVKQ